MKEKEEEEKEGVSIHHQFHWFSSIGFTGLFHDDASERERERRILTLERYRFIHFHIKNDICDALISHVIFFVAVVVIIIIVLKRPTHKLRVVVMYLGDDEEEEERVGGAGRRYWVI